MHKKKSYNRYYERLREKDSAGLLLTESRAAFQDDENVLEIVLMIVQLHVMVNATELYN